MSELQAAALPAAPPPRWLAREIGANFALAWPLVAANVAVQLMTVTDTMMMGWLSPKALAAGALGFNLYFPFFLVSISIMIAVAPIASQIIGAQGPGAPGVRRLAHHAFASALLICLPVWAVLWQAEPILIALGEDPELSALAAAYMRALQWTLAPGLLYFALRSIFSALHRTGPTLIAAVLAVFVNALANYALIFGHFGAPAWGVFGAGMGTLFSQVFMLAVLAAYAHYSPDIKSYHLLRGPWRLEWREFALLWRFGAPIAILNGFESGIFSASVAVMGLIGAAALQAHAIALNIASLAFMVPLGLAQAAAVRVGHAYGARDRRGISRAGWVAFWTTIAYAVVSALGMMAFPRFLMHFYIDLDAPGNAPTVALATTFLWIAALFQLFDGGQVITSNMLRGVGDLRVPMVLAMIGYWLVGAPLGLWLAFKTTLAGAGIWIGLAAGLAAVTALLLIRWRRRERDGFFKG